MKNRIKQRLLGSTSPTALFYGALVAVERKPEEAETVSPMKAVELGK